jgi:hypothetical protein
MTSVWFDFGNGEIQQFDWNTEAECDAFINGVSIALEAVGIDDYYQFDSQEEADEHLNNLV